MSENRRYRWKPLKRFISSHAFFRDELSGGIAISDQSGEWPDQSEDGVLWIDFQRPIKLDHSPTGLTIIIPLMAEKQAMESWTFGSPAELLYLMREHKMKFEVKAPNDFYSFSI